MENVAFDHGSSEKGHSSITRRPNCSTTTKCTKNIKPDTETAGPSWLDTSGVQYFRNNVDESKIDVYNVSLSDYNNLSSELKERLLLKSSNELLVNGSAKRAECENHIDDNVPSENDSVENSAYPIEYVQYESELQMPFIMKIIQKDLSEPYSIYTYRYFIHKWPKLCFLAMCGDKCVGAIVCKLDIHRKVMSRGYIAMLAVDQNYRNRSIGSTLVKRAIREMILGGADEVVLETEVTNKPALRLYEALGFVRDKRLFRYYLNGVDALRLKLWLR